MESSIVIMGAAIQNGASRINNNISLTKDAKSSQGGGMPEVQRPKYYPPAHYLFKGEPKVPVIGKQPSIKDQEESFPINGNLQAGHPVPVQASSPVVDMHEPASSEQVNEKKFDKPTLLKKIMEVQIRLKQCSDILIKCDGIPMPSKELGYEASVRHEELMKEHYRSVMQAHSDLIAEEMDANRFSSLAPGSVLEPVSPVVSSTAAYPIIESSDAGPPVPVQASSAAVGMHVSASSKQVNEKNVDKQTLLDKLEELVIKSKQSRRTVTNWDGILDQLNEMGYKDKTRNKQLLEKHNGSFLDVHINLLADEINACSLE